MTNPQQPGFDPFEQGDGVKAVSFKNAPIGSVITIAIDDDAKWLQSRDFETNQPKFWDARPGEQPNPVMSAVITGIVQPTPWAVQSGQAGERRSVWAEKPSAMFTAIQTAKRQAPGPDGKPALILAGGTLDIAFTREEPNKKNPNLNNSKVYAARYTPPPPGYGKQDAFEDNQTFGGAQQVPAAQPFQQAPQQQVPAAQPFQQAPQQQVPAAQPFQQPAMAGAPSGDPWASAPTGSDLPNF